MTAQRRVSPGVGYEEISLTNLTATDPVTSLEFDVQTEINPYRLDDVSVTAVPEPTTWTLLLGSGGLLAGALHRRRRMS